MDTSKPNLLSIPPMSALSLAVPPAQAVFAFPSPEQPWSSPSPTAQPTESPVLSAATAAWTIALPASSPPPPPPKFKWRNPKRMVDLSAFNISAFSGGRHNIEIVQGIPDIIASFDVSSAHIDANATASSSSSSSTTTTTSDSDSDSSSDSPDALASALATHWPPSTSTLQLHYPAGSINPAQPHRPIGGAQFYATPLDLARAHNVSLAYSAFFPVDFAWVRGGKMPGLYGGRGGCSGGDEARDCWSTRLMWRAGGEGEMYLVSVVFPSLPFPPLLPASLTHSLTHPRPVVRPKIQTTPHPLRLPALRLLHNIRPLHRSRRLHVGNRALDARGADCGAQHAREGRWVFCAGCGWGEGRGAV
ncbi:hypothetical protein C0992_009667 [Termitomyces sp. T32_za158]|nr:hypothetical protein C0992_009667 [Termitomyces sp. T32_za158]